ncbi:putative Porin [Vibrio nigripulchritudo MADA3029]|uniref:porin n=1 Tax=Vibrio nigripulchritudo TaxID=28173 RepID=UPI0003B19DCE|nr:porin [Vibrio nigripulchritudo]CCN47312.1 putative Porin [Vibrio nigripulchritudo MADA3020]CCN55177.1 putative Porin [Vibrio nigripulchritudo MADA3021]CCN60956.1 putative Porin [Vibrio nigripulchritudo MADA3029]
MKKTFLAVAVTLAATSVNAAEIYNKEGVKLDLGGAAEVQYKKERAKDSKGNFRLDDGDLFATTTVTVNDDLKGIGKVAFKFEKTVVENDELYVGLQHGKLGTFSAGRQSTTFDGAGIGQAIEFGLNFFEDEITTLGVGSGDNVVKYKGTFGNAWVGGSYADLEAVKEAAKTETKAYDLAGGYTFGNFETAIYFQQVKLAENDTAKKLALKDLKANTVHGQIKGTFDAITVAASYSTTKVTSNAKVSKQKDATINIAKLATSYKLDEKTTLAGGYEYGDAKGPLEGKVHNFYANVSHKLHSNVKVYAEFGHADAKDEAGDKIKTEFGYVAGLEVKF